MIARYTRPELARLWSDQYRFDTWLRVELAACEAMEAAGSVPQGTAAVVHAKAAGKLDPARILAHEERTRHDVIAFLSHVEELAGEPARWLHLGMTSSDVLDASFAIQLVAATDEILAGVDLLRAACRRRAQEPRATATPRSSRRSRGSAQPSSASRSPCATGSARRSARRPKPSARARRAPRPCRTRRTRSCRRTCAASRASCARTRTRRWRTSPS